MKGQFSIQIDEGPDCFLSNAGLHSPSEALRPLQLNHPEENIQKPTLPGIDALFSPSMTPNGSPDGQLFGWGIPRTPYSLTTPLQSPLSNSRISPISLPPIRNFKADSGGRTLAATKFHFPNSTTTSSLTVNTTTFGDDNSNNTSSSANLAFDENKSRSATTPSSYPGLSSDPDGYLQQRKEGYYRISGQEQKQQEQDHHQLHYHRQRYHHEQQVQQKPKQLQRQGHHQTHSLSSLATLQLGPQQPQPQPQPQTPQSHLMPSQQQLESFTNVNSGQVISATENLMNGGGPEDEPGYDGRPSLIGGSTGENPKPMSIVQGLGIYPLNLDGRQLDNVDHNRGSNNNDCCGNGFGGNNNSEAESPRYSQAYSQYGYHPGMMESLPYQQQQPVMTVSKDIKRRTKTGCLTCRRRRIKCDERNPTCLNCEKSKRICLGYDPIFRIQTGKRRRKASSWSGESCRQHYEHHRDSVFQNMTGSNNFDGKSFPVFYNGAGRSGRVGNNKGICETDKQHQQLDSGYCSPQSGQISSVSCVNTPRMPGTNATSPPGGGECDFNSSTVRENKSNRIKIDSLLDAAVLLESRQEVVVGKGKVNNGKHSNSAKVPIDNDTSSTSSSSATSAETRGTSANNSPPSWEDICQHFDNKVAPHLDEMFCTSRFSEISAMCNKKTLLWAKHGKIGNGEDLAALETIKQIVSILYPSVYVDNLLIDKKVSRLEELRITNNYKLLRCIVQLISSAKNTEFLPVSASDQGILFKAQTLHKFIHGGIELGPSQSQQYDMAPHASSFIQSTPSTPPTESVICSTLNNDGDIWGFLDLVARNGRLSDQEVNSRAVSCCQLSDDNDGDFTGAQIAMLLGLHHHLSLSPSSNNESKIRIRLLELSGSGNINVFLRRLIEMTLNL